MHRRKQRPHGQRLLRAGDRETARQRAGNMLKQGQVRAIPIGHLIIGWQFQIKQSAQAIVGAGKVQIGFAIRISRSRRRAWVMRQRRPLPRGAEMRPFTAMTKAVISSKALQIAPPRNLHPWPDPVPERCHARVANTLLLHYQLLTARPALLCLSVDF